MSQTSRQVAVANEARAIDESTARARAARQAEINRPLTAIEAMASRLQVSKEVLTNTLKATVFSGCRNNEEFVALVVVANEYQLNPLLKEIYAFPAKGGGIVPMVGVDGWMKLMNCHPQFDGIEFVDQFDAKGNFIAIEAVIYRKDRSHPVKLIEYLEECRRGTEPWKQMPRRMLRNRVICQAARLAFGFSGIAVEGDENVVDGGDIRATTTLPSKQDIAAEFDRRTGEVIDQPEPARDPATGMTEVTEDEARALDAGQPLEEYLGDEIPDFDQRAAADQTAADIDGPLDQATVWANGIRAQIEAATTVGEIDIADREWVKHCVACSDETVAEINGLITEARRRVREGAAK